jgi:DtxR family transcriptional regulator, Mn-dependent transcriptional regulator
MGTREPHMQDEYIEAMWMLRERGSRDLSSLKDYFKDTYDQSVTDALIKDGYAVYDASSPLLVYTPRGEEKGRLLIRAHRLAERLLFDVLHIEDYELAACEFEHILDTDLIDSICTLLGHPRRCPDGLPIPEGECCRSEQKTIRSPSVSVLELKPEDTARVVAVNAEADHQLHLLDLLQIRPGAIIRLHQRSPSIVIECDGSNIALDEEVASSIYVWKMNPTEANGLMARGRHRLDRHSKRKDRAYDCGPQGVHHGDRKPRGRRFWRSEGRDETEH